MTDTQEMTQERFMELYGIDRCKDEPFKNPFNIFISRMLEKIDAFVPTIEDQVEVDKFDRTFFITQMQWLLVNNIMLEKYGIARGFIDACEESGAIYIICFTNRSKAKYDKYFNN